MTIKNFINIINESATEVKQGVEPTVEQTNKSHVGKRLVEYISEVQSEEKAEPLSQNELSQLFDEEFPSLKWHRVMDEEKIFNQFKPLSDKIFGHMSAVPFGNMYVISTIYDSDIDVHKAISWIRQHGALVSDRIRYKFNNIEATGEVFRLKEYPVNIKGINRVANVSFLIYFDKHGEYVFAWSRDAVNESAIKDNKETPTETTSKKIILKKGFGGESLERQEEANAAALKAKRSGVKEAFIEEGKTWKDEKDGNGKKWDWKKKQQDRNSNKDKRMSGEEVDESEENETAALAEEMQAILNRAGMNYTVDQVLALNETDFVELALTTKNTIELKEATVIDSPVANAIRYRIVNQRIDLLAEYGLDAVIDAINHVAEFVGNPEEIGSSDVSAWVKSVENDLEHSKPKGDTSSFNDLFPNHYEKNLPETMTLIDDDELDESIALVDDGYMKHTLDTNGLESYLRDTGIIPKNGHVFYSREFEELKDSPEEREMWDGPIYGYFINLDERGEFYADVRDENDNTIFEIRNETDTSESDDHFDDDLVEDISDEETNDIDEHFEAIASRVRFGYTSGFYVVDGAHWHYDVVMLGEAGMHPDVDDEALEALGDSIEAGNIEGRLGFSDITWKLRVSKGNPIADECPSTVA